MMVSVNEHVAIMIATIEAYIDVIGDPPDDIAFARDAVEDDRARLIAEKKQSDPARFEIAQQLAQYSGELYVAIMVAETDGMPLHLARVLTRERQFLDQLKQAHQAWSYYWM
jgi:hypothetical protein